MNAFQNPLIRIIASIAVGLLLILYPNAALPTILLIIGILIGLPSLYALLIYLLSEDRNKLPFPVLSLVMLLFGCTLMLFPGWYIGITVYVLLILFTSACLFSIGSKNALTIILWYISAVSVGFCGGCSIGQKKQV